MEIGGYDIGAAGSFSEDFFVKTLKEFWPDACIDTVYNIQPNPEHLPHHEIFGYSSSEAKSVWDEHGLTDEFENDLIYIILEPDHASIVTGSDDSEITKYIIEAIKRHEGFRNFTLI